MLSQQKTGIKPLAEWVAQSVDFWAEILPILDTVIAS